MSKNNSGATSKSKGSKRNGAATSVGELAAIAASALDALSVLHGLATARSGDTLAAVASRAQYLRTFALGLNDAVGPKDVALRVAAGAAILSEAKSAIPRGALVRIAWLRAPNGIAGVAVLCKWWLDLINSERSDEDLCEVSERMVTRLEADETLHDLEALVELEGEQHAISPSTDMQIVNPIVDDERPAHASRASVTGLLTRIFDGSLPPDLMEPMLDYLVARGVVLETGATLEIAGKPGFLCAYPPDAQRALHTAINDHAGASTCPKVLKNVIPALAAGGSGSVSQGAGSTTSRPPRFTAADPDAVERLQWDRPLHIESLSDFGPAAARVFDSIVAIVARSCAPTAAALPHPAIAAQQPLPKVAAAPTTENEVSIASPGSRKQGSFLKVGDIWNISFLGQSRSIRDSKGMLYLSRLLASPGEPIHTWTLAGKGPLPEQGADDLTMDVESLNDARQRVTELQQFLREPGDSEAREEAERDLRNLQTLLKSSTQGGGQRARIPRRARAPIEQNREAVAKAIRSATAAIEKHLPELVKHLAEFLETPAGMTPWYRPPVGWPAWQTSVGTVSGVVREA